MHQHCHRTIDCYCIHLTLTLDCSNSTMLVMDNSNCRHLPPRLRLLFSTRCLYHARKCFSNESLQFQKAGHSSKSQKSHRGIPKTIIIHSTMQKAVSPFNFIIYAIQEGASAHPSCTNDKVFSGDIPYRHGSFLSHCYTLNELFPSVVCVLI